MRNPTMKPMFLPGVEENPKPGAHRDLISAMQRGGMEYLARFAEEILRGPGPLSPVPADFLGDEELVWEVLRELVLRPADCLVCIRPRLGVHAGRKPGGRPEGPPHIGLGKSAEGQ